LLARAERESSLTLFELDGQRDQEGAAYGACGRALLNQTDLLIAIWDGRRFGKPGGTEETLNEARRREMPVLWIDAHAPHPWQLLVGKERVPDSRPREFPTAGATMTVVRSVV